MRKALWIIAICWGLVVCFVPVEPNEISSNISLFTDYQFWFPIAILLGAVVYEYTSSWVGWKFLNPKIWNWLGFIALFALLVSWVSDDVLGMHIPRIGSFTTQGVLVLLFLLTMDLTKNKIGNQRAWFLGSLAIFASVGFWEIIYQVCSWTSYYHQWFKVSDLLYNEILVWRPHPFMVIPFAMLFCFYAKNNYRLISKWVAILSGLCSVFILAWVVWYHFGHYWLLWYMSFSNSEWVRHVPMNWLWYLLARSSKVVLAIIQVVLVVGLIQEPKGLKNRIYYIVPIIVLMGVYLIVRMRA